LGDNFQDAATDDHIVGLPRQQQPFRQCDQVASCDAARNQSQPCAQRFVYHDRGATRRFYRTVGVVSQRRNGVQVGNEALFDGRGNGPGLTQLGDTLREQRHDVTEAISGVELRPLRRREHR
jgi:hypothetical protein